LIGNHDVRELLDDPVILETFFHDQLTPDNARRMFTILNLAFKAALRGKLGPEHRIPANPCAAQTLPPIDTTARAVPSASEVAKILLAANELSPKWDLFCRLTATLGTRCGETVALRANDFDVARRRVHIDEAAANGAERGLVLKPPKSWEPRTLLIPNEAFWDVLAPEIVGREGRSFLFTGFIRDPADRSAATEPKCWNPHSAGHRFASMMKRVGLLARDTGRPYTLHSLRHYVATMLYNQSHDWVQVAKFLGHRSPAITMRLYANHVVDDTQRKLGEIAAAPWWGPGDALEDADVE
jgi:integrase